MPIIEVNHVTKEFRLGQLQSIKLGLQRAIARVAGQPVVERPNFKALDDVDFKVEAGEVLGIIGHNGAGKSTLLKILSQITVPTEGNTTVRGNVAPLIEVGAGLVSDLTGRENIYLNGAILGMRKAAIRKKFDEIVSFAELEHFIDTPIKRYSSGMQVRLGFAIATTVEADILIVDEVLAVGDLAFQRKCLDRMDDLIKRQGRTLLLVSHNIRQVERLCSRVLLLQQGQLVLDGEPKAVCNAFFAKSDEKIAHQSSSLNRQRFAHATSSGEIDVQGVSLHNLRSGEEIAAVNMHDGVEIRVSLLCQREFSGYIAIGFHTTDLLYVSTMSTAELEQPTKFPAGPLHVRCLIHDLPLIPNSYGIRVGIEDTRNRPVWYGEHLATLRVTPGSRSRTRLSLQSFVDIPRRWSIEATRDEPRFSETAGSEGMHWARSPAPSSSA